MSFSSNIKQKIISNGANVENLDCCMQAELLGVLRTTLSLFFKGDELTIAFGTDNIIFAGYICNLLQEFYNIDMYGECVSNLNRTVFSATLSLDNDNLKELLEDVGIQLGDETYWFKPISVSRRCCQRAFMRGVFLAVGSVADPEKSYHLEFVFKESMLADEVIELLEKNKIHAKTIDRKKMTVVYVKEFDNITLFFNIIGAHGALLELENISIMKEVRNNVNRITNCELANLSKTVASALRQIECIRILRENGKFDDLPETLKEVAILREKFPEYSLTEIGKCMSEPLGRSGVNHRLKKIEELAGI